MSALTKTLTLGLAALIFPACGASLTQLKQRLGTENRKLVVLPYPDSTAVRAAGPAEDVSGNDAHAQMFAKHMKDAFGVEVAMQRSMAPNVLGYVDPGLDPTRRGSAHAFLDLASVRRT